MSSIAVEKRGDTFYINGQPAAILKDKGDGNYVLIDPLDARTEHRVFCNGNCCVHCGKYTDESARVDHTYRGPVEHSWNARVFAAQQLR